MKIKLNPYLGLQVDGSPCMSRDANTTIMQLCSIDLGMSKEDRAALKRDVNVVLHCAATVRFDNSAVGLSTAVKINVRGLRELVALAKGMRRLVSFVHVSSGYVQCHLQGEVIQVRLANCATRVRFLIRVINNLSSSPTY